MKRRHKNTTRLTAKERAKVIVEEERVLGSMKTGSDVTWLLQAIESAIQAAVRQALKRKAARAVAS